jgi:hypothetical protein
VSAGSTSSTGSGDLPPLPLTFPIAVFNVVMDQKSSYGMKVSGDRPVYVQSVKPGKTKLQNIYLTQFFTQINLIEHSWSM